MSNKIASKLSMPLCWASEEKAASSDSKRRSNRACGEKGSLSRSSLGKRKGGGGWQAIEKKKKDIRSGMGIKSGSKDQQSWMKKVKEAGK